MTPRIRIFRWELIPSQLIYIHHEAYEEHEESGFAIYCIIYMQHACHKLLIWFSHAFRVIRGEDAICILIWIKLAFFKELDK